MMAYSQSGSQITQSNADIRKAIPNVIQKIKERDFKKNINLYKRPRKLQNHMEMHFIKFENLEENLKSKLRSLNIPNDIDLPHLKKGDNHQDEFILSVTTPEEMQIINDYYDDEFNTFKYQKIDPSLAAYRC